MTTLHNAASILDLYFTQVRTNRLNSKLDFEIYGLTALLISAKSYEKDDRIPKSGHLIRHMTKFDPWEDIVNGVTSPRIIKCEREILKAISWSFENYPSFYTIVELFKSQGVLYSTDRVFNTHY
jgi:hypothetical protein